MRNWLCVSHVIAILRRSGLERVRMNNLAKGWDAKEKQEGIYKWVVYQWTTTGPLPCVPETRTETQLTVAERQQEEEGEDGNRKPTGVKFASGKATSDYFIWLAARRAAFCPYMDEPTRIVLCFSFPSLSPCLIFFLLLPSHSLLSFYFFGTVPLFLLSFSRLRPPCSPPDRFPIGIILAMVARSALSQTI